MRQRGFTLIEIMVAMGLAGIVSAFLLMITRSQLMAYQMNENITDAQLNARAGAEFVESALRRACGGIAWGAVGIDVAGATVGVYPCLQIRDGVEGSGSPVVMSAAAAASASDTVDIIYGSAPVTQASTVAVDSPASAVVCDTTGFANGDLVLVSNMNQAIVYRIKATGGVTTTAPTTNCPVSPGTLAFDATGTAATAEPPAQTGTPTVNTFVPSANVWVMKATSLTIYRFSGTGPNNRMLMVQPDGLAAASHANDQPIVEGVENFELALGSDTNGDGVINDTPATPSTDEWLGNAPGVADLPAVIVPPSVGPAPYFNLVNSSGATPLPQYRQVRATLLVRTVNTYPGDATVIATPVEDRTNNFVTSATTTQVNGAPRYRVMRVVAAPRVWNLLN